MWKRCYDVKEGEIKNQTSHLILTVHNKRRTISSVPALSFDLATKDISPQLTQVFYCFELKTVDCHPEISFS